MSSEEKLRADTESLEKLRQLPVDDEGQVLDTARVEMTIIGPHWSPVMRFRFYMSHRPEDHVTVWMVRWVSKWLGTYTPPGWFLKLIGQAE